MSKPTTFAKEEIMEDYLQSLLTGHEEALAPAPQAPEPEVESDIEVQPKTVVAVNPTPEIQHQPVASQQALVDTLDDPFQSLLFEVAGLTLAVPLTALGGIHNMTKVAPIVGKPDWFKGVMLHRDDKLNVVDTARWVMPEKVTEKFIASLSYQYLIMLADSPWGLASDKLVSTVTLAKEDVKWRKSDTKRPWLAGMVKERMCALIDVYQLISMLNKGLGRDEVISIGEPSK